MFKLLIALSVLSSCALVLSAQSTDKKSPEFRKAFLDKFSRTSLNTTPEDAMMLRILIEGGQLKRGIEVGVASGFGALNMGIGFERTGGKLYSIEIDKARAEDARANVAKLGLENIVTVMNADALKALPEMTGEFDFIFIDALKSDYMKYLKLIEPRLKRGAVVVADNVIVSARAMKDYLEYVQTSPNYDTVIIRASSEKGDGMAISYKIR